MVPKSTNPPKTAGNLHNCQVIHITKITPEKASVLKSLRSRNETKRNERNGVPSLPQNCQLNCGSTLPILASSSKSTFGNNLGRDPSLSTSGLLDPSWKYAYVDRSTSSTTSKPGKFPYATLVHSPTSLRIFVDVSVIELYVDGNVISSRVYPDGEHSEYVIVEGEGVKVELNVMGSSF